MHSKLVHEVVTADSNLAFSAPKYYETLCQEKIEQIDAIIAFLDHVAKNTKEASVRDVTREVVAFGVDWCLIGKVFHGAGKFFSFAKNKVPEIIEKVATAVTEASEPVAVTVEGIPFKPNSLERACHSFSNWMGKAGETAKGAAQRVKTRHEATSGITKQGTTVANQFAERIPTVWDKIKPTKLKYANTRIPKSFELYLENGKFLVHPNATKHILEFLQAKNPWFSMPNHCQAILTDFTNTVKSIAKGGIKYNSKFVLNGWEIIFSPPHSEGLLPVIHHALYIP